MSNYRITTHLDPPGGRRWRGLTAAALLLLLCSVRGKAQDDYYPPSEAEGGWRALVAPNGTATDAQKQDILSKTGLNWDVLNEAWNYDLHTIGPEKSWPGNSRKSLLIIRHGWIVLEQYQSIDGTYHKDSRASFASGTKTLVGVSLARLFSQGRCQDTDYLYRYMPPSWSEAEPARKKIQLRHVLTMSSGLEPYDGPYEPTTYGRIIQNLAVIAEPGTQWFYNTGALDLMNYCVADRSGKTMAAFLNDEIVQPIGGGAVLVEPRHRFQGHGFCSFYQLTPRDYARIGYLFLRQGRWKDEQLIDRDVVSLVTTHPAWLSKASVGVSAGMKAAPNENYAYTFWLNRSGEMPGIPPDAFMASGGNHKMIVMPSLDMIVTRVGNYVQDRDQVNQLYGIIRRAVTDKPPEVTSMYPVPAKPPAKPAAAASAPTALKDLAEASSKNVPSGRHIEIEAESGVCTEPMRVAADAGPPAVRFVWVSRENPANYDVPGGPGSVAMPFHIPQAGPYNIWVRTIAPDSHSDSYFLCLDGEVIDRPWHTEAVPQSQVWQWNTVRQGKQVEAGNHVLEFRHRESGIQLDRIIITADLGFSP